MSDITEYYFVLLRDKLEFRNASTPPSFVSSDVNEVLDYIEEQSVGIDKDKYILEIQNRRGDIIELNDLKKLL